MASASEGEGEEGMFLVQRLRERTDTAIEFFIQRQKQVETHEAVDHLYWGSSAESLDECFRGVKALPDGPRDKKQLRELRDEIEDTVKYTGRTIQDRILFLESIRQSTYDVKMIGNIVGDMRVVVKIIVDRVLREMASIPIGSDQINQEHNGVVGMTDQVALLSRQLMKESRELQFFAIYGIAGTGKTILAQTVFHDARIVDEFPIRIWVYISQTFTPKEIFLHIINYFTLLTDDIKSKNDKELADLVVGFLENEKFLLVMDDLWSSKDWDRLKIALPMSNKMGRVLITTRIYDAARYVYGNDYFHEMSKLSDEESLELLRLVAFCGERLPLELELEGILIAKKCVGHPLAVVLVGGILVKQFSRDMQTMKVGWRKVSESLSLTDVDTRDRVEIIIRICYENLPHHLRECFLYFGMFPEGFEIPVWKLIRLWIAEGFIQEESDASLEETAENYLQELIDRNLVRGMKFKLNGKVKTCRVHDLILDFCIEKASSLQFFKPIEMFPDGNFRPSIHEELNYRRTCIHSNALNFFSEKPSGQSVGSFICSSREEMDMPMKDLSTIPKGFKMLSVLDMEPINFNLKLPRDLFQLLHLKYLFLSVKLDVLPSAFSHLMNMQTLVFNTSTRTLEVRADILNLTQLRHFKTKASASLPVETSASSPTAGENFQAIGAISPESCTKDVFGRARNLKKLGVRGNLALLLDGKKESFDSLGKLENLENLKLLYDVYPIPPSGLTVISLPPPDKFPPKLKILTLSRTCLDWCHMSVIKSLENLEVLKLEDKAFVGETWEVSAGGFCHLEVLRIERMNLKNWLVSNNQFPKLKHLQLRHCDDLHRIPAELADIPSLLKLELYHSKRAAASAREIEAKIKQDIVARKFDLSISPFQR